MKLLLTRLWSTSESVDHPRRFVGATRPCGDQWPSSWSRTQAYAVGAYEASVSVSCAGRGTRCSRGNPHFKEGM